MKVPSIQKRFTPFTAALHFCGFYIFALTSVAILIAFDILRVDDTLSQAMGAAAMLTVGCLGCASGARYYWRPRIGVFEVLAILFCPFPIIFLIMTGVKVGTALGVHFPIAVF